MREAFGEVIGCFGMFAFVGLVAGVVELLDWWRRQR